MFKEPCLSFEYANIKIVFNRGHLDFFNIFTVVSVYINTVNSGRP